MAFGDELAAFRAYADCFPDSCLLLVDTYDTLTSGLPHAITMRDKNWCLEEYIEATTR